jgi:hypothetical protein
MKKTKRLFPKIIVILLLLLNGGNTFGQETPTIIGSNDGDRCGSGSVTLFAIASAGEVKWYTVPTGGVALYTGQFYITEHISATTLYWVEAVDNGYTSPRVQVVARIHPIPTVDFDYSAQIICEGETTEVRLVNPSSPLISFTWNNDATIIGKNSDGSVITIQPPYTNNGNNHQSTYTYTVTVDEITTGCAQSFIATVNVDEALSGNIAATLPQICEGFTTTIDAGSHSADTYIWTSSSFSGEMRAARITVSPPETTIYMVEMSRGACTVTDEIIIDVSSKPVILLIDSVGVHDREIIPKPGFGTYPFRFGVDELPADDDPLKRNLLFGNHTFYIVDAANCYSDAVTYFLRDPDSPNSSASVTVNTPIEIYPNPFTDKLEIEKAANYSLTITDMQGRIQYQRANLTGNETIITSGWAAGIYLITLSSQDNNIVRKVVKY